MIPPRSGLAVLRLALGLLLAAVLSACGGGGGVPYSGVTIRPLPADFTSRKAVAYSPYRTATSEAGLADEVITKAQIRQDLDLLLAAGFRAIRLFDSSDKVARQTLEVIRDDRLNIKVQLGAFVLGSSEAASRAEIARCVALANEFRDTVLAVSVGNETMVSWAFNRIAPPVMADYLRSVRSQITQPVTTDDNYAFWASAPTVITDVIDYAALHTYANLDTWFDPTRWQWKFTQVPEAQRAVAMMDAAIAETRRQYLEARDHLDAKGLSYLPIIVGETGWNAVDVGRQRFRAHPVNQKMYLDRLQAWVAEGRAGGRAPRQVFYFEAFDEPWKQGDDKWGLFNVQRQARYAVQALNADGSPAGTATWTYEPVIAANDADGNGVYTDADATYFVPPTVNPAITASRYTLYSDLPAEAGEFRPTGLRWDAFDGTTAAFPETSAVFGPGDPSRSLEITPQPASYGWGLLRQSPTGATDNLSAFQASGRLSFLVSTTYPGAIEVGISTDTQDRETQEAYLQLAPGRYGYCNTGAWCTVSIPLADFVAVNPKLDLSLVLSRFVIADRYAFTGKPANAGLRERLFIDAVRWTR
ncbi:glycosyl hydrolase family 17 protein [Piscinibacter sakaiensis]|uniref:Endo-1,3-beta-glucanase btgC n=1 Tax=Piscinibacter sakaiensis TaxID=1547922 RepID=A0A0K8P3Y2_PISS1|nr:glycosyl hydrolase family 17 protein [Piscinibacter sakaiensis]GAP37264.1 beta (1-6) glucans synthase [Piscinibacter sakaiensis]